MVDCVTPGAALKMWEIGYCIVDRTFGGNWVFAGIIMFLLMVYAFHKFRIPMAAAFPFGILVLYLFGNEQWGSNAIIYLGLLLLGAVGFLAIYKWLHR